MTTQNPSPDAPTQLGPYRLIRRLGGGGMGQIYLADQSSVGRQVAIKVLPPEVADDPEAIARFQREVKLLGQLSHPNICPVIEAGTEGGTVYYAMEYLRGLDLAQLLKTQRIEARRAVEIAAQVARALEYAHSHGIIHRDVKPLNIMLVRGERRRGGATGSPAPTRGAGAGEPPSDLKAPSPEFHDHVYLIDFGLARSGEKSQRLTMSGLILGTPAYMSPEQAAGDHSKIGPGSDLYALGATLYELFTLRAPFAGQTPAEILHKVIYDDPRPPRQFNPGIDRDLETIVQTAMEKDPARRYPSAAAMADDLEHWLAGDPIRARPASLVYRVRKTISRNKLASVAIAAALLVLLGGLILGFAPGRITVSGQNTEGSALWIDGSRRDGTTALVWPPRKVRVRVSREGFDDFETDVVVRSRASEAVAADLVPSFGSLTIVTDPAGASVLWDGADLGTTPLRSLRARTGLHRLEVRLSGHLPVTDAVFVTPGRETRVERSLRHEEGFLTLTSEPPEVAVELRAADGSVIMTAAPATKLPLKTGKYRGTARARNRFAREFEISIESGGEAYRHLTLNSMVLWQHAGSGLIRTLIAADVNSDPYVDIVTVVEDPPALFAFNGRDGRILWRTELPNSPPGAGIALEVADFDGDLAPEIAVIGGWNETRIHEGKTGRLLRTLPLPARFIMTGGDLNGDGRPELLADLGGFFVAAEGVQGRRLWSIRCPDRITWASTARLNEDGVPDVYISVWAGPTVAIDGKSGGILWQKQVVSNGGPLAVDGNGDGIDDVVVGGGQAIFALSGRDGSVMWQDPEQMRRQALTAGDLDGDGKPEILLQGEKFRALDAATGKEKVKLNIPSGWGAVVVTDLTGDGRNEMILNSENTFVAVDPCTGGILWTYFATDSIYCHPILGDFNADGRQDVVMSYGAEITAITATDPPLLWQAYDAGHYNVDSVYIIGDPVRVLFAMGTNGNLLRPADGFSLAKSRNGNAATVVDLESKGEEVIVVATTDDVFLLEIGSDGKRWSLRERWKAGKAGGASPAAVLDINEDGSLDLILGDSGWGGNLKAVDGRSGGIFWEKQLPEGGIHQLPVILDGIYCHPGRDAVLGLRPKTGEEVWRFATSNPVRSLALAGQDLVFGTRGGEVFRIRPSGAGRPAVIWRRVVGESVTAGSPVIAGDLVVLTAGDGTIIALALEDGAELWRSRLEGAFQAGPALYDIDDDRVPDIATVTQRGQVVVVSGLDGRLLWTMTVPTDIGEIRPVWSDVDRDGRSELLVTARNGFLYVFHVRPTREAAVYWTNVGCLTERAACAATVRERMRVRAEQWRFQERWEEIEKLVQPDAPAIVWYYAALSASRRGDRAAAAKFAAGARARGCYRLDAELLRCRGVQDGTRMFTSALAEAPFTSFLDLASEHVDFDLWRAAAAELAPKLEADGAWERLLWVLGAFEKRERIDELGRRALEAGIPPGRVLVAQAFAAFFREDFPEARRALNEARRFADTTATASDQIRRLDVKAEATYSDAVTAWKRGQAAEALVLFERAMNQKSDYPMYRSHFGWYLARARAGNPERAIRLGQEALEMFRKQSPDDLAQQSLFLDWLAAIYFAVGDREKALATQKEALKLPVSQQLLPAFQERLKQYQKD